MEFQIGDKVKIVSRQNRGHAWDYHACETPEHLGAVGEVVAYWDSHAGIKAVESTPYPYWVQIAGEKRLYNGANLQKAFTKGDWVRANCPKYGSEMRHGQVGKIVDDLAGGVYPYRVEYPDGVTMLYTSQELEAPFQIRDRVKILPKSSMAKLGHIHEGKIGTITGIDKDEYPYRVNDLSGNYLTRFLPVELELATDGEKKC